FTLACYETGFESLTIAGGNATESAVMVPSTSNSVFFFIGEPLTIPGATVSLFDSEGYFETLETGNFLGDIIENVPYGEYNYTVELDCYETIFGSVTVDCAGGNGVSVAQNPVEQTTNSVFFFIGEPLTLAGATVSLFDSEGYFETLETGNFLGDIIENVPFGEYSYTVEADCYETITGSVTVECIGGGQGVVVAENPVPVVLDNSVTADANTLTAAAAGLSYQWVDCDNGNAEIEGETGQSFTATEDGNYAVVISSENCSITSQCFQVIVTGIFDASPSIEVSVYPNPFTSNLNIRLDDKGGKTFVEIISITGQLIVQENFTNSEFIMVDVSDLASGTYLLKVRNDLGQYSAPIVKQ
ncbi:MAG: T9SS type A sorting domain-containing protein, partial [Cryomorphaceae bacterium]